MKLLLAVVSLLVCFTASPTTADAQVLPILRPFRGAPIPRGFYYSNFQIRVTSGIPLPPQRKVYHYKDGHRLVVIPHGASDLYEPAHLYEHKGYFSPRRRERPRRSRHKFGRYYPTRPSYKPPPTTPQVQIVD